MQKQVYIIVGSAVIVVLFITGIQRFLIERSTTVTSRQDGAARSTGNPTPTPNYSEAQRFGDIFARDFIAAVSSESDSDAAQAAYAVLSDKVREKVSPDRTAEDLLRFFSMTEPPGQDVQVLRSFPLTEGKVWVVIRFQDTGNRVLQRAVLVGQEDSAWKVFGVGSVEDRGQI